MKTLTILCGAAIALCGALQAQSTDRITFKLPTAVVINGTTIPAGNAAIDVLHGAGTVILNVRSDAGPHASVLVNRFEDPVDESEPKLILDRKGDTYRLDRILLPDHTTLQVLAGE